MGIGFQTIAVIDVFQSILKSRLVNSFIPKIHRSFQQYFNVQPLLVRYSSYPSNITFSLNQFVRFGA